MFTPFCAISKSTGTANGDFCSKAFVADGL